MLLQRNILEIMKEPFYNRLVQRIYQESMTAFDPDKNLPIRQLDLKNLASYSIGRNERYIKTLDTYAPFTHYDSSTSIDKLRKVLPLFDYVVVGVSGEVRQEIFDLLNELENIVIVSSFGELDVINKLNTDISKIVAYEHNDINEESAVELIFGAIGSKGRLPMTMSNLLIEGSGDAIQPVNRLEFSTAEDVCMDGTYLEQINNIIVEAIQDKATPGCQVVVARKGKVVFNKAFGYQTYDSIKPINANSIYDLASITKVAATTQAVMFLSEHQLIDLDKKVSVYLKDLKGTNKENMIIRDVLTHQAGLWPYLPFWKETLSDDTFSSVYYSFNEDDDYPYELSQGIYVSSITQDSVWLWVKQSKLREREPNITYDYKYSDMGYYMLQRLVEQLVNQPMEEFLQQNFYDPMGLATMSYLPLCRITQDINATTEI